MLNSINKKIFFTIFRNTRIFNKSNIIILFFTQKNREARIFLNSHPTRLQEKIFFGFFFSDKFMILLLSFISVIFNQVTSKIVYTFIGTNDSLFVKKVAVFSVGSIIEDTRHNFV